MAENPNPTAYTGNALLEQLTDAVNYNGHLASLVRRYAPEPLKAVIDFGAGQGLFSGIFKDTKATVVCVESDASNQKILKGLGYPIALLPELADASVDYIYTINVLEHIEADETIMAEFTRVLRPGGRVFVWVPALPWLWTDMDDVVFHCRRYQRGELRRKLTGAGLTVHEEKFADSLGILATLAFKFTVGKVETLNPGSIKLYDRVAFPFSKLCDALGMRFILGKNLWAVAEKKA